MGNCRFPKLKAKLKQAGVTYRECADAIGISEISLTRKIGGSQAMYLDDCERIAEYLNMTNEEKTEVFLSNNKDITFTQSIDSTEENITEMSLGVSELQVFNSNEFGTIRTTTINNEPYFVGKDIAVILGYSEPRSAVSKKVDEEDRGVAKMETPSGTQEMTVINESGLYSLVLSSKLPSAKRFKRWVTNEVLPSIRKHGMYAVDELVNNPDLLIKVATELKQEREQNARLTKKIEDDKPLVEFATYISESVDTIDMSEMAKVINSDIRPMGRNRLITLLKDRDVLMDNNLPYQEYIDRGYFEVAECPKNTVNGTKIFLKAVVTGKGQMWLIDKFRKGAY